MRRRSFIQGASALAASAGAGGLVAGWPGPALAAYPDRPINIVVPFPPGGLTDLIGRRFAMYLEKTTGQPAIIENKAGASGQVGAQGVARARPDGQTLLVTATHFALSAAVRDDLPYDPVKDFAPVALFVTTPNILVVNPKVPVHNLQEYIDYANRSPGGISFGSSGAGGATHLSGELLKLMTQAKMEHIPYKGMVLQVNDLLGGQLESGFVDPSSVTQFLADGKLRAIGVTGKERFGILPDVPTFDEQGVKGYESTTWIALLAPAGTPPDIVRQLNELAIASLQEPGAQTFIEQIQATPNTMSAEDFAAYLQSDVDRWTQVAKAAGLRGKV